jgi:hypothetical protein
MVAVHEFLKNAIIIYLFFCTVWGLFNGARQRRVTDSYRTTLFIAEGLFIAQTVVGLALLGEGRMPGQILHFLYGFLGLAVLPIAIAWIGTNKKRDSLWLGLTCLFLLGIALRAWTTGLPAIQ